MLIDKLAWEEATTKHLHVGAVDDWEGWEDLEWDIAEANAGAA